MVEAKKRGRPKGSKNKPKITSNLDTKEALPKKAKPKTTSKPRTKRGQVCLAEGQGAEELFIKLIKEKKWKLIRKATPEEDMESHWDYMFKTPEGQEVKVDIKNMKKRRKKFTTDILVEFRSVLRRGKNYNQSGWIYGEADYIAFRVFDYKSEDFDCFLIINREKLLSHAKQMVMGGQVSVEGREGRFDKYVYLPVANLIERGYIEHIVGGNRFLFPKILSLGR